MSKIKDILSIELENDIKNVIDLNSQNEEDIKDELDGFILTESLAKHLSDFLDVFCSDMKESGVWLSGFYGSGKSYFAKMIGFLIANPVIKGTPMRDRFMPKLIGLKNKEIIENQIRSLGKTDYQVTLFDCAKVDSSHGISYMAMSHFLLSLGFLSNWIGMMEFNLMLENRYDKFLATVKEQNAGKDWYDIRKKMSAVPALKKAILTFMAEDEYEETRKLIDERIKTYDATKLKEDLSLYLEHYPEKKIVFFIDEVSEALSQKKINLLDLEGLSEALSSLGNKVWTVGIAQQAFNDVLNASGLNIHQLNKVEARFKTRIPIAAEEIDTIIRKRLLAKTDSGKEQLEAYYDKNNGMIQDITHIAGVSLNATKDEHTYADYYPFYEHQFKLLQYFLFGSRDTVTSQIGTRGMLVSVFDVLKKEAMTEADVFTHVNATQLCRQAEENVPEALRMRYEQADNHIGKEGMKYVEGRALLQTIHFLEKANAYTTIENITKSYVRRPEDYYSVLAEVKKALEILVERNVLITSGNQYRITSQIEQQIIDDMNSYSAEVYRVRAEVTKILKQQKIIKISQTLVSDGQAIPFCVENSLGENFANAGEKYMKVSFYDVFYEDHVQLVASVKQDTQSQKGIISIIPSSVYGTEIFNRAQELLKIDYIETKTYHTADEKKVVNNIVSAKEEKMKFLTELINKSYTEGTAVYLFNTYQLTDSNYQKEIESLQRKMFGNIFYKRLGASLSDSLAVKVLTANTTQLTTMFGGSEEFRFFDSAGKFIGENLSVSTEILEKCKSYCTGDKLEEELSAPPTGYKFGTIITSVAALFRGNKLIAKFNGEDFHSVSDALDAKIFDNTRNFAKASFKAVMKSLSYNDRQEIVDILKEDCQYKKITGENAPSYNLNDFELVDCIRTLSKRMMDKVKDRIMGDDEMELLFKRSVQARNVFSQYTAAVTDANYIATARTFLQEADDYIKAVEQVQKDLKFIDSEFKVIEEERVFIQNVTEEFDKTGNDMNLIRGKKEQFEEAREKDLVANAPLMKKLTQDIKDIYYEVMKHKAELLSEEVIALFTKTDELNQQIDQYPKDWNIRLYRKIEDLEKSWKRYATVKVNLDKWSVKCSNTGMLLRDIEYKITNLGIDKQEVSLWDTEIITQDPSPKKPDIPKLPDTPTPEDKPASQPKPIQRNMKAKLPKGTASVAEYRSWLKQQLVMLNMFGEDDILNFDN